MQVVVEAAHAAPAVGCADWLTEAVAAGIIAAGPPRVPRLFSWAGHDAMAIASLTESGSTALWMSRVNTGIPIYALTQEVRTRYKVSIFKGVFPLMLPQSVHDRDRILFDAEEALSAAGAVAIGDLTVKDLVCSGATGLDLSTGEDVSVEAKATVGTWKSEKVAVVTSGDDVTLVAPRIHKRRHAFRDGR